MYPHPTQLSDFLQSAGYIRNAAFDRTEQKAGPLPGLFNSICCVKWANFWCWTVCKYVCVRNLHDIQHAPNTQLAEIYLIVQKCLSNLLGCP